jgi:poly-gamma-glutamate synthesis protein (capsule biosynthesis protein)
LVNAGFDVLNFANNHSFDLGVEGFMQTAETLKNAKIGIVGISGEGLTVIEKNGFRFGFLGYSGTGVTVEGKVVIPPVDESLILSEITEAKKQCEHLVVSLHWGTENVYYPSPDQVVLAHKIIDAGTALILGHHPHVLQPIEQYKNGVIAYSLGNFQFCFLEDVKTRRSAILSVIFSEKGIDSVEIFPTRIEGDYSVSLMTEMEKKDFFGEIGLIAEKFEANKYNERFWFEQIAPAHLSGNLRSWGKRIRKYGFLHFLQCLKWSFSPFVINCYIGMIRRALQTAFERKEGRHDL